MEVDFIVKLGGSAITDKARCETVKLDEIERAAATLAHCHREGLRFVVLHGAGSFGHHHAKAYSVKGGYADVAMLEEERRRVKLGFGLTRISVTKLNAMVVEALASVGVPAVTFPACGSWSTNDGRVMEDRGNVIGRAVVQGFVPVIHGDCVFDQSRGCTILSGDTIFEVLCEQLRPKRGIFLMDCAGIFTLPPHMPGSTLIENILVCANGSLHNAPTSTSESADRPDVTGGVGAKLQTAARVVHASKGRIPVYMCSTVSDAFHDACVTGRCHGTRLSYVTDDIVEESALD